MIYTLNSALGCFEAKFRLQTHMKSDTTRYELCDNLLFVDKQIPTLKMVLSY